MKSYEMFEVEDFICDAFFIDWVLNKKSKHQKFWEQWQLEHPKKVPQVEAARRILVSFTIRQLPDELSEVEVDEIITNIRGQINFSTYSKLRHWALSSTWARAAAVLIVLSIFLFIFEYTYNRNESADHLAGSKAEGFNEYQNNTVENRLVRFVDGSLAVLKPKSKIRYPKQFTNAKREVFLVGEAFFEVARNVHVPFYVHSGNMVTQVLGTSFTVIAYHDTETYRVIVNTGKVKVFSQLPRGQASVNMVTLAPRQQAIFDNTKISLIKDTVTAELPLAKEAAIKSFTLNKVSMEEVIVKLEDAYRVRIIYDKASLGKITLSAQLYNLPLDQKIELICKAINAVPEFSEGEIIIKKTKH